MAAFHNFNALGTLILEKQFGRRTNRLKRLTLTKLVCITAALLVMSFGDLPTKEAKQKWKLAWQDEFNYEGLPDSTKWNYDIGGNGWGNDELQYYSSNRKQNGYVSEGYLYIQALKENYLNNPYTSARLVTKGKKEFMYGKFEIRAKIPKGKGVWPAFWMLSAKEPRTWPDDGEIDIMENVGYTPGEITGAAHVKKNKIGTETLSIVNETIIPNASEAFHVYSLIWTPDRLEWFVDDKLFHFYDKAGKAEWQWPFNENFYLLLNVAVGGSWGGRKGVDDAIFPQAMLVDYVRVYKGNF